MAAAPADQSRPDRHGLIGPFTGRQLATGLAVVMVSGIVLVAITRPVAPATGPSGPLSPIATQYLVGTATEGLKVGDRAPELMVTGADGSSLSLTDLDGRPIRLADLRGHPVWIDFWASWCPPCQSETPVLRDMYASYRARGLVLVAISVQETDTSDVRAYASRYGLQYTVAADLRGDVFRSYRIYGLPTQFFLDSQGIIRSVVQGPVDYDSAAANLALIMPGQPVSSSSPPPSPSPSSSPSR